MSTIEFPNFQLPTIKPLEIHDAKQYTIDTFNLLSKRLQIISDLINEFSLEELELINIDQIKKFIRKEIDDQKEKSKDEEFLRKIKIEKYKEYPGSKSWFYDIYLNGEKIGDVTYYEGCDHVTDVYINKQYRQKGIATSIYDSIEKDFDVKLKPITHTPAGVAFWKKRLTKNKK